jgi:hypothetical protein
VNLRITLIIRILQNVSVASSLALHPVAASLIPAVGLALFVLKAVCVIVDNPSRAIRGIVYRVVGEVTDDLWAVRLLNGWNCSIK